MNPNPQPVDEGKNIDINHTMVKVPVRISLNKKNYPITQWNINVVREYWDTDDEKVLDKLKDFALKF